MVKSSVDRRISIRAKRILSIEYRLSKTRRKSADLSWHLSTTQDMSIDGISFFSEYEYRVNEVLEIHIVMSGVLDIFKGLAKIVRVQKKKTGVHYLIALKLLERPAKSRNAKSYSSRSTVKKRSLKRI